MDRRNLRTFALAFALLALTGCIAQNVRSDLRLKQNEGVFLATIACGADVGGLHIHPIGTGTVGVFAERARAATILACRKGGIRSFAVPAGTYYISQIFGETGAFVEFAETQAYAFDVEAGSLSYIGHIEVTSGDPARRSDDTFETYVTLRVEDRATQFRRLYAQHPGNLLGRYPLRLAIASRRPAQLPRRP